jgi:hypothetical protein
MVETSASNAKAENTGRQQMQIKESVDCVLLEKWKVLEVIENPSHRPALRTAQLVITAKRAQRLLHYNAQKDITALPAPKQELAESAMLDSTALRSLQLVRSINVKKAIIVQQDRTTNLGKTS